MMLRVEYILHVYMAICIAMLLFHFIYFYYDQIKQKRIQKKMVYYEAVIRKRYIAIDEETKVLDAHKKKLMKKLTRLHELIAFHEAIQTLVEQEESGVQKYLKDNLSVFQKLAGDYLKKDAMHRAYYAYLMKQYSMISRFNYSVLAEIMLQYFDHSTIYCRENVLQAFYQFGNINMIVTAFQYLNDHKIFHHDKLITDGLMQFQGNKEELALRLWKFHTTWSEVIVLSIVNFIRLSKLNFCTALYDIVNNARISQEVRLSAIRYFRTVQYAPIEACLHEIILQQENYSSIMANVACLALYNYPSEETKKVLKQALCDSNWYVRQNAAISFLQLQPSTDEIHAILNGHDRYAKEMLTYQIQKMKKEVK